MPLASSRACAVTREWVVRLAAAMSGAGGACATTMSWRQGGDGAAAMLVCRGRNPGSTPTQSQCGDGSAAGSFVGQGHGRVQGYSCSRYQLPRTSEGHAHGTRTRQGAVPEVSPRRYGSVAPWTRMERLTALAAGVYRGCGLCAVCAGPSAGAWQGRRELLHTVTLTGSNLQQHTIIALCLCNMLMLIRDNPPHLR